MSKTPRTYAHCQQIIDDALGLEYAATELQYWAEKLEEELAAALEQRDNEIQKRKEMSEAIVKLFKYLRPYLTDECQKLVDAADVAIQECGK